MGRRRRREAVRRMRRERPARSSSQGQPTGFSFWIGPTQSRRDRLAVLIFGGRPFLLLQAESISRRAERSLLIAAQSPSVSRIGVIRKTSLIPSSTRQTALAFAARCAANAVRFWLCAIFTLAHCCACGLQSCTGRGYGIIVAVLHCCASQQCKSALNALAATPRATRPPL